MTQRWFARNGGRFPPSANSDGVDGARIGAAWVDLGSVDYLDGGRVACPRSVLGLVSAAWEFARGYIPPIPPIPPYPAAKWVYLESLYT